jgi:hypothetical protein
VLRDWERVEREWVKVVEGSMSVAVCKLSRRDSAVNEIVQ